MNTGNRPLSPHLQVYRPQLTSVLSITHRATGVVLTIGTLLLVYWLLALAAGPQAFETARGLFASWFGRLLLFAITFALFYHLCNGIRHLCWDIGLGFDLKSVYTSGKAVVASAVALTLLSWIAAYSVAGGSA